jgi:hypothetical protein
MGNILIDKLLSACVKQNASDIHLTVGQPPVFRMDGRMRKLETKVLEPDDTVALMKSITPDRCQHELLQCYVMPAIPTTEPVVFHVQIRLDESRRFCDTPRPFSPAIIGVRPVWRCRLVDFGISYSCKEAHHAFLVQALGANVGHALRRGGFRRSDCGGRG